MSTFDSEIINQASQMKPILYVFEKHEIEKLIKSVVNEVYTTNIESELEIIPTEKRLTQAGAATFLGCTVQSLIRWRKKLGLPFYRIGGQVVYNKQELIEFVRAQKQKKKY